MEAYIIAPMLGFYGRTHHGVPTAAHTLDPYDEVRIAGQWTCRRPPPLLPLSFPRPRGTSTTHGSRAQIIPNDTQHQAAHTHTCAVKMPWEFYAFEWPEAGETKPITPLSRTPPHDVA